MRETASILIATALILLFVSCGGRKEETATVASSETAAPVATVPVPTTTSGTAMAAVTDTTPAPPVPTVVPLTRPAAGSAAKGATRFASKCASCHGADARGETAIGKKNGMLDFRAPRVQALSGSDLRKIMDAGAGKVSQDAHPAAKLTDEDVRDVLAFIHTLK